MKAGPRDVCLEGNMPLTRKSMLDLFASSKFSRLTQGALSAFAPEGSRAHESREKRDNRGSGLLVIVTFIVYHSMTYWQLWQFGGQFQHALLTCARCLASAQVILPYLSGTVDKVQHLGCRDWSFLSRAFCCRSRCTGRAQKCLEFRVEVVQWDDHDLASRKDMSKILDAQWMKCLWQALSFVLAKTCG